MGMIGNSLAQGLISGANIQDGTVDTPDIKDSAVTAAKIASGVVTPAKMDFSAGTANGVAYLNGAKVLTTGSALVFDGTNLGVGVPPSAWSAGKAQEIGFVGNGIWGFGNNNFLLTQNAYYNSGWKYASTGPLQASYYQQTNGTHAWNIAGAGTAGNAISFTQAMTLDASGNLVVGDTSALGGGKVSLAVDLSVANGFTTKNTAASYGGTNLLFRAINSSNASIGGLTHTAVQDMGVWGYSNLILSTGVSGSERARIDSSGNMLLGTTSSGWVYSGRKTLHVAGATTTLVGLGASSDVGGFLYTDNSTFTVGNNGGGNLVLNNNGVERARIDSSGNLLVGATGTIANFKMVISGTNDHLLLNGTSTYAQINYFIGGVYKAQTYYAAATDRFITMCGTTGGVYLGNGSTSWASLSDERTKDIIEPIVDGLKKLSGLRTVIGKYKTDEDGTRRSFLIAQDVQDSFPEAVDATNVDELGVRYQDLIPVLVKAIQEQQAIIESLTQRITALETP